jgi:predicted metal-dependent phosphoesterase TrpH
VKHLRILVALVLTAGAFVATRSSDADPAFQHFVGSLHEHSGYSDGKPGTRPATYFAKGKAQGIDFLGSGEHSDNADIPVTANETCASWLYTAKCVGLDPDSQHKWDSTLKQARAATTPTFTGFRGFEWTSDRFGHINVYFSTNDTNAKADGGYGTMETFYRWLTTSPSATGGGADGLATFNHPGAKKLTAEAAVNWNDFAYVPSADNNMVGIEVYNDDDEYGTTRDVPEGYYAHALDKGWHLGPVGAEDLHGTPGKSDYGAAHWAKTVILAHDRSEASLRAAMQARRFYAVAHNDGLRLDFTLDDAVMGSRLVRTAGSPLHIVGSANRSGALVEVVTSGGQVVAGGTGNTVDTTLPAASQQRYYFLRVREGGKYIGYSAPIWVSAAASPATGRWLAGDLHVHTCFSHDAYCGPSDDNTGPEEFYTYSGDVSERFLEASARGLDYLAITDHNDIRSQSHPGFGSQGVIPIPAYENSLSGHAQMLGAKKIYAHGDGAAAINTMADELRTDGGVFQINHPGDQVLEQVGDECKTSQLDWAYGFDVEPDTLEVWNIGHVLQPPMPAGNSNDDSVRYWECWLDRGARVGATGGSDSHWLALSLAQGPGFPTTWAFAQENSTAGVLAALKDGRTSISLVPPVLGGLRLILEADANGDGVYEAMIGDEVPAGTRMRVRADGLPGVGLVEVRANSQTIVDNQLLLPGGEIEFNAPSATGWVRATLHGPDLRDERAATCDPLVGTQTTYCRDALVELALTSPIYLS